MKMAGGSSIAETTAEPFGPDHGPWREPLRFGELTLRFNHREGPGLQPGAAPSVPLRVKMDN
jgi:hypothetical protein